MIQGTMSNAGKSLLVAGLCRVFVQDGYSVAPFKSQNMALNSHITDDGLEMARAQVIQAEAAGITPSILMNPILLKPTSDSGSEVIVNGESRGNMAAADYFEYRWSLVPDIMRAFESLAESHDIVVIEGAGSPAEINLRKDDIVNMGLAELTDADVLLVGDIDRGGVFAQLVGTLILLDEAEQKRVKGLVINKFRGDIGLLHNGVLMLEEKTGKPVVGTLPYLDVDIEDEDSLSSRFSAAPKADLIDVAVIRLPRIASFSGISALGAIEGISVRYVDGVSQLGHPDLVIVPDTNSLVADLNWLRSKRFDQAVHLLASQGVAIFGLGGGYQMLGEEICDSQGDLAGRHVPGLAVLPVSFSQQEASNQRLASGRITGAQGLFTALNGALVKGHFGLAGSIRSGTGASALISFDDGSSDTCNHLRAVAFDGCCLDNVAGSSLPGFFESAECRLGLLKALLEAKGLAAPTNILDYQEYKQKQYDILADAVRQHLDMEFIYGLLGLPD
jgi:adenosylcobyric acid synthase